MLRTLSICSLLLLVFACIPDPGGDQGCDTQLRLRARPLKPEVAAAETLAKPCLNLVALNLGLQLEDP